MISFFLRFILIPIGLVIVAGELIRRRGNPDTVGRRYFLFLIWTGMGLWAISIIINRSMSAPSLSNMFTLSLAPVTIGVAAMAFLNLREWRVLQGREKKLILSTLLLLVVAQVWMISTQKVGLRTEAIFLMGAIFTIFVFLFMVWTIGNRYPILVGMIALLYMLLFNELEGGALPLFDERSEAWLTDREHSYLSAPAQSCNNNRGNVDFQCIKAISPV